MVKKCFALLLVALFLLSIGFCEASFAGAYDDLEDTYEHTSAFDGGSGSTINTSPSAYDSGSSVPDIGPSGPVDYSD